jgi:putative redox protein
MEASVKWLDGVAFEGESGEHRITIDGPPEYGGRNRGMRPMAAVLIGAAACSAFDVVHILRKAKREPAAVEVQIRAERADSEPRVFTALHLHFRIRGDDISAARAERAVSLSVEKYCSALAMLAKTAKISHSLELAAS